MVILLKYDSPNPLTHQHLPSQREPNYRHPTEHGCGRGVPDARGGGVPEAMICTVCYRRRATHCVCEQCYMRIHSREVKYKKI